MQAERVQLVVVERVPCGKALGAAVAGAPVDGSGNDRRAAGHRASDRRALHELGVDDADIREEAFTF